jgi:hypothetical protein
MVMVTDSRPGSRPSLRMTADVRYTYSPSACLIALVRDSHCVCDELGVIAMGTIVIAPVKDAYCILVLLWQVAEKLAESRLVFLSHFWS